MKFFFERESFLSLGFHPRIYCAHHTSCTGSTLFSGISSLYCTCYTTCCIHLSCVWAHFFFRNLIRTRYMTKLYPRVTLWGLVHSSRFYPCTATRYMACCTHMSCVWAHLFLWDFIRVSHSLHDKLYPRVTLWSLVHSLKFYPCTALTIYMTCCTHLSRVWPTPFSEISSLYCTDYMTCCTHLSHVLRSLLSPSAILFSIFALVLNSNSPYWTTNLGIL